VTARVPGCREGLIPGVTCRKSEAKVAWRPCEKARKVRTLLQCPAQSTRTNMWLACLGRAQSYVDWRVLMWYSSSSILTMTFCLCSFFFVVPLMISVGTQCAPTNDLFTALQYNRCYPKLCYKKVLVQEPVREPSDVSLPASQIVRSHMSIVRYKRPLPAYEVEAQKKKQTSARSAIFRP
jgi:hypothetical protein